MIEKKYVENQCYQSPLLNDTHEQYLACHTYYMQTAWKVDSFYLTDIIRFDLEKLFGHVSFCSFAMCWYTHFAREKGKGTESDGIHLFHMCALSVYINR